MSNLYTKYLLAEAQNHASIIEGLLAEGWVPITQECQPYAIDILPQFWPRFEAEGYRRALTPVFKVNGVNYAVKTHRIGTIKSTDNPFNEFETIFPLVLNQLVQHQSVYIYSVIVAREAVYGYLPPDCLIWARSAKCHEERCSC